MSNLKHVIYLHVIYLHVIYLHVIYLHVIYLTIENVVLPWLKAVVKYLSWKMYYKVVPEYSEKQ